MKKDRSKTNIYSCIDCGYKINEKLEKCPICLGKLVEEKGNAIEYNKNLPESFKEEDKETRLTYYCYKCHQIKVNKVCTKCNTVNYLCLVHKNKKAIINKMDSLYDIYGEKEIKEIAANLGKDEKDLIYHNFNCFEKFFYKKDKVKASVSFIIAIVMYSLFFMITKSNTTPDNIVIAYITNTFGNSLLFIFLTLSIWYLKDAYSVEYKNIASSIGTIAIITGTIYLLLALLLSFSYEGLMMHGIIHIFSNIIIYAILLIIKRKIK